MSFLALVGFWLALVFLPLMASAQDGGAAQKLKAYEIIDAKKELLAKTSDAIYSYSEPGFQEFKTSELLLDLYKKAGFKVEKGIAGMPTAFVGVWGSGKPVFALMADYDAQLTASQKPGVVHYDPIVEGAPGHGEGHNGNPMVVYGAAVALKAVMEQFGLKGTIKVIGGPAEETIGSRAFMISLAENLAGMLISPQAFLSTKSEISGADTFPDVMKPIKVPLLLMYGTADFGGAVYPSDMKAISDAAGSASKKYVQIEGADHVFDPSGKKAGKRDQHQQFADVIANWIKEP